MGYLLTEIIVYLVIAGLIGFVFGWLVKAGALDKYVEKLIIFGKKAKEAVKAYYLTLTTNKTVVKETKELEQEVQEDISTVKEEEPKEDAKKEELEIKEETKVEVEESVVEVSKEEEEVSTSTKAPQDADETSKPMLYAEVPTTGQDELSALKGLGPVLEKKLNTLGVYTYEQMASWTLEQETWVGTQVAFPNKVTKEEWVKQAKEILEK